MMSKKHKYIITVDCDDKTQQTYMFEAENNREAIRMTYFQACDWQMKPPADDMPTDKQK